MSLNSAQDVTIPLVECARTPIGGSKFVLLQHNMIASMAESLSHPDGHLGVESPLPV